MKKKSTFYRDGDNYLATEGQIIKNLPMLRVTYTGDSPSSVKESCHNVRDLEQMTPVESADVPEEWLESFECFGIKVPKPAPKPAPKRQSKKNYDLFHGHLAAGCDVFTAAAASGIDFSDTPPRDRKKKEPLVQANSMDLCIFVIIFWIVSFFIIGMLV